MRVCVSVRARSVHVSCLAFISTITYIRTDAYTIQNTRHASHIVYACSFVAVCVRERARRRLCVCVA